MPHSLCHIGMSGGVFLSFALLGERELWICALAASAFLLLCREIFWRKRQAGLKRLNLAKQHATGTVPIRELMDPEIVAALETAFDSAQIGLWTWNTSTGAVTCSRQLSKMLGLSPERRILTAEESMTFLMPEDLPLLSEAIRRATSAGGIFDGEYRVSHASGGFRWHGVRGRAQFDAEGRPTTVIGVAVDVTEQHEARERLQASEEQLRQSQKMEAIGKLAGGIAHDFNNMLTIIINYADLMMPDLPEGSRLRSDLQEIVKAGERATALTKQLLAFSRKQVLQPRVTTLNEIVANIGRMIPRLLGDDITVDTALMPSPYAIEVDAGQIEQVILNLVVNARDAMPQGGRITIATANLTVSDVPPRPEGEKLPKLPNGRFALLSVADNGIGMSPEVSERIFEPFFTTKPAGEGTGLGLSTVYGIVQQSSGFIQVVSKPRVGTRFEIYLPAVDLPMPADADNIATGDSPRGSETVLLVEDNENLRKLARQILRSLGYHVIEATCGAEALQLALEQAEDIRLVLTDVIMPAMSGRELAQRIEQAGVKIRFLYMSGYTDDAILRHGVARHETNFLQKPFLGRELAVAVRHALDT